MKSILAILPLLFLASGACVGTTLVPLIGEEPEIGRLLGSTGPDLPGKSPLATARRVHQALSQQDSEVAWSLLSLGTRHLLDTRAGLVGSTGRELLQRGTLPNADGTLLKVNFTNVFFGSDLQAILPAVTDSDLGPDRRTLQARSEQGTQRTIVFLLEADGWKLHADAL